MVLVANSAALAENHQNSAEFYASLPREKSLLCCVCHEHNTTFRYEVIYKSGPTLGHKQQPVNSGEILFALIHILLVTWALVEHKPPV